MRSGVGITLPSLLLAIPLTLLAASSKFFIKSFTTVFNLGVSFNNTSLSPINAFDVPIKAGGKTLNPSPIVLNSANAVLALVALLNASSILGAIACACTALVSMPLNISPNF